MPASVVDASALGALLFGEPAADRIAATLEGRELAAPSLLPYEVASICVKKIAAHPREEKRLLDAMSFLPSLGVKLFAVPSPAAVEVARQRKLTAYDASYLWLAAELEAELVTLDEALARAWRRRRA